MNNKIKLRFGKFIFAPSWLMIIITALLSLLFISLGCWQLHRFEEKKLLLEQHQDRSQTRPLSLDAIQLNKIGNYQYYSIQLNGYYDNAHTFLLDNRTYLHQLGYHVITPFIINSQVIILVNRGWVARNVDRRILPTIPAIAGPRAIKGNIYIPLAKTFVLSNAAENQNWPRIIQSIDFAQLEQWLNQPLQHWILLLSPEAEGGFVREWKPAVTPQKNLSYALQWFTFAAILLFLFIILNIRRYYAN